MKKPAGMRPALTALALALALPGASARAGFVEDAQQALAAQQQGRRKEAALLWRKATEQNPDGFIWDLRGWSDLGDGDAEAARQDFLMGIDRATATSTQAEANLGLGLAALALRKPEPGLAALGKALLQTPFVIPAASYETALLALKQGDNLKALAFLRQALSLDPLHLESLRALARLADTLKRKDEAWAAYARLAQLDPGDSRSVDRLKALARSIPGDPSQGLAPRRLSLPLLDASAPAKPPLGPEEPRLRVALFSDGHGAPATLTQISFLTNAPFRLEAGAQTINKETTPGDPWRLVFRPERGVLEVRDGAGNLRLTTQQTVRIIPLVRQGSVLVKNAVFAPGSGFDPGDRELRGSFEAHPTGDGFLAVNEVPLEDYLYSVVGAALPQGSPPEALKAQAVAARTLALWYRQHSSTMAIAQLCDSPACQLYAGVNAEMRHASDAVSSTEGLVLTRAGQPLKALQQEDCGGLTETGPDGPGPAAPTTPLELERFLHAAPAA
ncbi:MAG: SpoIID/LytB domain-containing protein, partial [Elusimicrobia bacterium]|nr:SpoIID/LytB domain-containing protein [Elusimicrobiota bacterium]